MGAQLVAAHKVDLHGVVNGAWGDPVATARRPTRNGLGRGRPGALLGSLSPSQELGHGPGVLQPGASAHIANVLHKQREVLKVELAHGPLGSIHHLADDDLDAGSRTQRLLGRSCPVPQNKFI
jgi:hypothetical protein